MMQKRPQLIEVDRAMKRWRWIYFTGYVTSAFIAFFSLLRILLGDLSVEAVAQVAVGIVIGILSWQIHKNISIKSIVAIFVLTVLSTIEISFGDNAKDIIGSWILTAVLFRGILAVRLIRRFRDGMRARQNETAVKCD